MAYYCYGCGKEIEFAVKGGIKVGRLDVCEHCGKYLHCCKNCKFHDPSVHNQCTETYTAFIRDREAANFCSSFRFRELDSPPKQVDTKEAKEKLNALFKNLE
ncbi:MAG: hypothetical protein ACQES9_04520 [Myxococcota bacterium]